MLTGRGAPPATKASGRLGLPSRQEARSRRPPRPWSGAQVEAHLFHTLLLGKPRRPATKALGGTLSLGCSQMEINRSMAGASLTAEATCVGEGGGPAAWGGSGPDTRWARFAAGLPVVAARGGAREVTGCGE